MAAGAPRIFRRSGRGRVMVALSLLVLVGGGTAGLRAFVIDPLSRYPILTRCSMEDDLVTTDLATAEPGMFVFDPSVTDPVHGTPVVQYWSESYHAKVDEIVTEILTSMTLDKSKIECENLNPDDFNEATPGMLSLASKLTPWKKASELATLKKNDVNAVLLEYLRVYECVLKERKEQLLYLTFVDKQAHEDATDDEPLKWWEVLQGETNESAVINREIGDADTGETGIARESLNRTLQLIGGMDLLQPIRVEAECLQRASLEARNAIGLSAEALSCMPRMVNAKDVLRDDEPPS